MACVRYVLSKFQLLYSLNIFVQVEFPHDDDHFSRDCPLEGHIIRVLYAFSWADYPLFHAYPNRPAEKMVYSTSAESLRQLKQYFHSYTKGKDYAKEKYYNIYDIFLFAMKHLNVVN